MERSRRRKVVAATIFFAHSIKHIYHSGHQSLIMPEIKMGMSLNRAQFGSFGTASAIAWWIGTMLAGYLGDRFNKRAGLIISLSLFLMGASLSLAGFINFYLAMVVVMFIVAIGPSMFHPPALGELSRNFPEQRGFVVSLHGMGASLGEVLGPPVVASLLSFMFWRDVLKLSIFPSLLVAIGVLLLIRGNSTDEENPRDGFTGYVASLLNLLKDRLLLILILASALRSIGETGVTGFLSLYLREDLGYSFATVAVVLSISQAAGIMTQPLLGYLSDKFGRKIILTSTTGLISLVAFGIGIVRPGIQLFFLIVLNGAFAIPLHHLFVAAALDLAQGITQSTVVSLIYGSGVVSIFIPYIVGLISDRFGIQSAFLFGGTVLLLPTMLLFSTRFARLTK